jgi:hypothetical protein
VQLADVVYWLAGRYRGAAIRVDFAAPLTQAVVCLAQNKRVAPVAGANLSGHVVKEPYPKLSTK